MDGILLPIKGQATKNLARTLAFSPTPKILSKKDEERVFTFGKKIKE